jgi:hypothetical protein
LFLLTARISGPGLSGDYFYLIDHSFALIMLQFQLESLEIAAYTAEMRRKIAAPSEALHQYYRQFEEVGLSADAGQDPTRRFHRTKEALNRKLDDAVNKYWYALAELR